jgi:hypothetical protein
MTTSLPQIDFARIRDHEGTKYRAWEELSYLLAWDLDGLDAATAMERRGTPDGGIEFSCVPTGKRSGGRWAWQANTADLELTAGAAGQPPPEGPVVGSTSSGSMRPRSTRWKRASPLR